MSTEQSTNNDEKLKKLAQEYQNVLQQYMNFKDAAYQNALLAGNIKSYVTGKLLEIETTDIEVTKKLIDLVKELNKIETPKQEKEEETIVEQVA